MALRAWALLPCVAFATAAAGAADGIAFQRIDVTRYPKIVVYFTVEDAAGSSVLGLAKEDLEAAIDGAPRPVAELDSALAGGESLATALLFDRSGSMKEALDETKRAARSFLERLSIGDLAAVVSFDDRVSVEAGFTSDVAAAAAAVERLTPGRDTALYDAVALAVGLLEEVPTNRKAIIVLSDGKDTKSLIDRQAAIAVAAGAGVPVFTVALAAEIDEASVAALADETGGGFFRAARSEDLLQIYQRIGERLENQYRAVVRAAAAADESWHELRFSSRSPRLGELVASREFVASVGPGVSRGRMRGFQRDLAQHELARGLGFGALAGFALGLLLVALIAVGIGGVELLSLRALGVLSSATALGGLVGVLITLVQ